MVARVGSLQAELTLESGRFNKGLSDAQRKLASSGKEFDSLGSKLGGLGKAFAATGAVFAGSAIFGVLKDAVKSGLDYASSLGEQAQQIGVTAKALQEYRYAAGQAGLSSDEMDQALTKLTRSIGEAGSGSKTQAKAFADLGINVRDANGNLKNAGDLLPEIAEKLKGIHDPAERAAVLVDIFGKSGQKLEPLLAGGAAGLDKYRKAANDLGIVMSDALIKKADEAADKMGSLNDILQAKISIAVVENIDSITAAADAFIYLIGKISEVIRLYKNFKLLEGEIDARIMSYKPFVSSAERQRSADLADRFALERDRVNGKQDKSGGFRDYRAAPFELKPDTSGKAKFAGSGALGASNLARALGGDRGLADGLARLQAIAPAAAQAQAGLAALSEDATPKIEEMADRTQAWRDLLGQLGGTFGTTGSQIAEVVDQLIVPGFQRGEEQALSLQQRLESLAAPITGLLSSIFGRKAGGIIGGILNIGLTAAKAFGGIPGPVSTPPIAPGGRFIPQYASGTRSALSGLALVGERGPELVNFAGGERVFPNGQGPGGGRGSTIQVIPSPLFDVVIDGKIVRTAPSIMDGGARIAQSRMVRARTRSLI